DVIGMGHWSLGTFHFLKLPKPTVGVPWGQALRGPASHGMPPVGFWALYKLQMTNKPGTKTFTLFYQPRFYDVTIYHADAVYPPVGSVCNGCIGGEHRRLQRETERVVGRGRRCNRHHASGDEAAERDVAAAGRAVQRPDADDGVLAQLVEVVLQCGQ